MTWRYDDPGGRVFALVACPGITDSGYAIGQYEPMSATWPRARRSGDE